MAGETIESTFRDFTTLNVPSSGKHEPRKPEIRNLLNAFLGQQTGANAGALIQTSKTALDALSPAANTMAWVIGDADPNLDGVYQYDNPDWVRRAPLPYNVIPLNNADEGTANAIEVTTAVGIPSAAYGAVYLLPITAENTGPVTISINGGTPKPVVSNTGQPLAAGTLQPPMGLLALDDGTNLRLFVYGNVEAILAGAEAAQAAALVAQSAAEDARDAAEAAAAGVDLPPITADTMLVDNAAGTAREAKSFDTVRTLLNLPRSYVRIKGVGDGIADDTAAINAAIGAAPVGGIIDGEGKTYKVTGDINGAIALKSNITLQNMTIDFSDGDNDGKLFRTYGSIATPLAWSGGSTAAGAASVTFVNGSTLSPGDWVWVESGDLWDSGDDNTTMGEMKRVLSVSTNTVTFYDPLLYTMTAASVTAAKITWLENITLRNVKAFGSGAGASGVQYGADFGYIKNLVIEDCDFKRFDDRAIWLWRCLNPIIDGNSLGECNRTGLSYGVQVAAGTFGAKIVNNDFVDCRHGTDLGDNDGVCRGTIIRGNTYHQMREHPISTHTASDGTIIDGNTVYCDPNTVQGGILDRGLNTQITNNVIHNANDIGIECLVNPQVAGGTVYIAGNKLIGSLGVTGLYGIYVRKNIGGGTLHSVVVKDNVIKGRGSLAVGVFVRATTANIDVVDVSGNVISGSLDGVLVQADSTFIIGSVAICNNSINMTGIAGTEAIYCIAAGVDLINDIVVTGNTLQGTATYGYRGANDENVVVTGNNFIAATTGVSTAANNNVVANNLVAA